MSYLVWKLDHFLVRKCALPRHFSRAAIERSGLGKTYRFLLVLMRSILVKMAIYGHIMMKPLCMR